MFKSLGKYFHISTELLTSAVLPEFQFSDGNKLALLAFKRLDLPLGVDPGDADLKHPQ